MAVAQDGKTEVNEKVKEADYQFPENLSSSKLKKILRKRSVLQANETYNDKDDLVRLFRKFVLPLPQRPQLKRLQSQRQRTAVCKPLKRKEEKDIAERRGNDASPPKQIKVEDQHSVLPRHDKKDKIAVKASTSFIRLSRLKNETPSKPVKLKRRHISSMKEKDADFSDKKDIKKQEATGLTKDDRKVEEKKGLETEKKAQQEGAKKALNAAHITEESQKYSHSGEKEKGCDEIRKESSHRRENIETVRESSKSKSKEVGKEHVTHREKDGSLEGHKERKDIHSEEKIKHLDESRKNHSKRKDISSEDKVNHCDEAAHSGMQTIKGNQIHRNKEHQGNGHKSRKDSHSEEDRTKKHHIHRKESHQETDKEEYLRQSSKDTKRGQQFLEEREHRRTEYRNRKDGHSEENREKGDHSHGKDTKREQQIHEEKGHRSTEYRNRTDSHFEENREKDDYAYRKDSRRESDREYARQSSKDTAKRHQTHHEKEHRSNDDKTGRYSHFAEKSKKADHVQRKHCHQGEEKDTDGRHSKKRRNGSTQKYEREYTVKEKRKDYSEEIVKDYKDSDDDWKELVHHKKSKSKRHENVDTPEEYRGRKDSQSGHKRKSSDGIRRDIYDSKVRKKNMHDRDSKEKHHSHTRYKRHRHREKSSSKDRHKHSFSSSSDSSDSSDSADSSSDSSDSSKDSSDSSKDSSDVNNSSSDSDKK